MKFRIIALLVLALSMPSADAVVIPKAGAACSKIGAISDYKGKRYTCVKSGAKRVWNKGVAIPAPKPSISVTPTPVSSATPTTSPTPTPTPTPTVREYSLSDIAQHASAKDCWSALNGDVYDLTDWISQHPGGAAAIRGLCGVDGSRDFNRRHEGDASVAKQLSKFIIGRLKG